MQLPRDHLWCICVCVLSMTLQHTVYRHTCETRRHVLTGTNDKVDTHNTATHKSDWWGSSCKKKLLKKWLIRWIVLQFTAFNFLFFPPTFSEACWNVMSAFQKEIGSELMWSLGWPFFFPPFFLSDIIAESWRSGRTDRVGDCVDPFFKTPGKLERRHHHAPMSLRSDWTPWIPSGSKTTATKCMVLAGCVWASLALSLLLMI